MKDTSKKEFEAKVEALALKLYDKFNPEPFDEVKVSKHKCIQMARERLLKKICRSGIR